MEVKKVYKQTEIGVIPEDWGVKQLRDVATYRNGKSYEDKVDETGDYFLITLDSLDIRGKLKPNHKKISRVDIPLSKNDLIMILSDVAHGYFLGLTDLIPENEKYILNQRIGVLKAGSNIDPRFLSFFINHHQSYFKIAGQGSSQQNLSKSDIINFPILVPTLAEQEAIAEALSDADALIEALEGLIAKKRQVKQGAMQELLTGKRRLPGFSGKWTTKKLGELGRFYKGKGLPKDVLFADGRFPAIPYTAIYTDFNEVFDIASVRNYTSSSDTFFISDPHILIAGSSNMLENVGKVCAYVDDKSVAIGGDIILFKTIDDVRFISYLLNTPQHRKKTVFLSQGSTIRHVYMSTFINYEIEIPELKEQTAIAEILSDMDAEIAALEGKLVKARDVKAGMMSVLLTGKIRLLVKS